ncbi:MAG: sigma-70 family RNA polymerase sigma factor [Candidatus Riflebacteria bacterium]|nr:sigma-70 family RNA polymerase sigma factor [Candidatus Riflebacteria bacterium]
MNIASASYIFVFDGRPGIFRVAAHLRGDIGYDQMSPVDLVVQSLVESAKKGDLQAFESLVRKYQGMVFRYLFHFIGNEGEAEDITQETFLMVFRKLHLHNSDQPFTSWMMRIARNLAISNHRKNVPTPIDPAKAAVAIRDITAGPEYEVLMKEDADDVHLSLQRLSEEFREVLILRYILDIPLQDVADLLELPEGTAKSRVFKARNALRDILSRKGTDPG